MELTSDQAFQIMQQAVAKAKQLSVPSNIAIMDIAGHMKLFHRMDEAWLGSIDIAIKKARTAMLFRCDSEDVGGFLSSEDRAFVLNNTNGGLVGFGGGMPVMLGTNIIAYIGVSGGSTEQDMEIARAGSRI
jgi:uncharacterized protein GlcG (DUF336 family)